MRLSNGEKEGIASWAKRRARMRTMKEGTMTRDARPFGGSGGVVEEEETLDAVGERAVALFALVVVEVGSGGEGADEGRDIVESVSVADGGGDLFGDVMVNGV
jgi:hypothetical protein